jgi:branched-chain amino acid transport system permease protein
MLKRPTFKWIHLAAATGLAILVSLPWVLSPLSPHYLTICIMIGIYTLITVGLCLLMGYTGQVSLGQAAFFGIGAYLSAILSKTYGLPPWGAMAIAAVGTGLFAYIIGWPVLRLRGNYLAMATLALGVIVFIVFREAYQYTGGTDGLTGIPSLSVGGFAFNTEFRYFFLVWFFCIAVLLISQNIVNSRTGRALRAIRDNEAAAESMGVNALQLKAKVFALSAVYASLAGSLLVHYWGAVGPNMFDVSSSIEVITMAVVGGLASVWGAIFGAGAVTYLNDRLLDFGSYNIIAFGLILMVVMIFLPKGLWVHLREGISRWQRRRRERAES